MLCITGLPLIFHHEIDELTHEIKLVEEDILQSKTRLANIVDEAKKDKPDWTLMFVMFDDEKPIVRTVLGSSMQAQEGDVIITAFDSRSGDRLIAPSSNEGVMYFILDLHASMLMGLPGTLFLGLMGFVFLVSVISGVVVYAPFMRKLSFATVRKTRNEHISRLDTHNMVGIITLAWVFVVGLTGFILTMNTPIGAIWQKDQLSKMAAPYKGMPTLQTYVSPDIVLASILEQVPDANINFISWPGSPFATPYHYTVALRGNTPLTERLLRIAMVDAKTGQVTNVEDTPWYMSAMFLSVPLHFGDYGGLPLKIIWALFDIAAVIVLWTGLKLWLKRWRPNKKKSDHIVLTVEEIL
jgi:uncharacterized iron-regulated membrane protein